MYLKRVPVTAVLTSMGAVSVTQMKQNPIISIWVARIFQKTIFIRQVTAQKGQLVTAQKGRHRMWVKQKCQWTTANPRNKMLMDHVTAQKG